jgi:hypothetical protein
MAIDVGDLYRCSYSHTSPSGGAVNAGTMTLTVTLPDGTTFPAGTIAPGSTGQYLYDYQTIQAGRHSARWVGTGANPGAYGEVFDVRPADLPYIISLADAKAQLNTTTTVNDEELRTYVEAATGVIERHLGQAVVRRARTEEHCVRGGLVLNWTPVVSLTSVALVDGTYTWNVADLHVSPAGVVTSPLKTAPYGEVAVTYLAGMSVIPEEYCLAARIIVQHLWKTQRPERGAPGRGGALDDSMGYQQAGFAIPNRAIELLGSGLPGIA